MHALYIHKLWKNAYCGHSLTIMMQLGEINVLFSFVTPSS
jgi:hypothetical protein